MPRTGPLGADSKSWKRYLATRATSLKPVTPWGYLFFVAEANQQD